MILIVFGTSVWFAGDAHAECINQLQSQTIAAAYEGDIEPTVNLMDTCSGDDIGYQIPIATTIVFDGVEYSNIYATTNSVITFGTADPTYWDYPTTPSISLYSMDWYPGANNTSGLDIYYSDGGFQINLEAVPFGQWNAEPSIINILVAVTNSGGMSVSYSYQGPEYSGMRTGVRLHDGSIVSLEAWGATQIQPGEEIPSLEPEPIPEPSPSPTGPTEEELVAQEEARVISNLLASAAGILDLTIVPPVEEPDNIPSVPEIPEELPNPDVVVDPEIITPEDPEFPEDIDVPTQPDDTNQETDSGKEDEQTDNPVEESNNESQQGDEELTPIDDKQDPQPSEDPVQNPDSSPSNNNTTNLLADLSSKDSFIKMTERQKEKAADFLGIPVSDLKILAEAIEKNEALAEALNQFDNRLNENNTNVLPYTLADATTEIQTEQFLSNPVGALLDVNVTELLSNFSELGSDMTEDQREKAQEVIVPVIIASQIAGAVMRRLA